MACTIKNTSDNIIRLDIIYSMSYKITIGAYQLNIISCIVLVFYVTKNYISLLVFNSLVSLHVRKNVSKQFGDSVESNFKVSKIFLSRWCKIHV